MDGKWNFGLGQEANRQADLMRHRLLRVNLANNGAVLPGDASGFAATAPAGIGTIDGGPHFVMSPVPPDNSPHTYGFEFCIALRSIASTERATAPFTVTVWELIGTSEITDQAASFMPIWASFATSTGLADGDLYHSFDVNAAALRFQIVDSAADPTVARSVVIAFCEL